MQKPRKEQPAEASDFVRKAQQTAVVMICQRMQYQLHVRQEIANIMKIVTVQLKTSASAVVMLAPAVKQNVQVLNKDSI